MFFGFLLLFLTVPSGGDPSCKTIFFNGTQLYSPYKISYPSVPIREKTVTGNQWQKDDPCAKILQQFSSSHKNKNKTKNPGTMRLFEIMCKQSVKLFGEIFVYVSDGCHSFENRKHFVPSLRRGISSPARAKIFST